jgi:uncharacterized protein YdeI (YjbR/CyaY-like superfamily)
MKKNPEVDAFIDALDNPLKEEIEAIRKIILNASNKIEESIKWKAPSFFYKDNMATFNPRAKKYVTLIFHKGALIKDKTGLLEGDTEFARTARFYDMNDVKSKRKQLENVVKQWINVMDSK